MTKGKRLTLTSHHFYAKLGSALWADVWARTTVKPGRTKRSIAPCLIGLDNLEEEEAMNLKYGWDVDPDHQAAKAAFAAGANHFIGGGPEDLANIYAPEARITMATAERLCLAYAQHLGINATRTKWKRNKYFSIAA